MRSQFLSKIRRLQKSIRPYAYKEVLFYKSENSLLTIKLQNISALKPDLRIIVSETLRVSGIFGHKM